MSIESISWFKAERVEWASRLEVGKKTMQDIIDTCDTSNLKYITPSDILNLTGVESEFGTHTGTNRWPNMWPMQVDVIIMTQDIINRPWYFGIKVTKEGFIDIKSSNQSSISLLSKASGMNFWSNITLESITKGIKSHVKDYNCSVPLGILILKWFDWKPTLKRSTLKYIQTNLNTLYAKVKKELNWVGMKYEDVTLKKFTELVKNIQTNNELMCRFAILKRYNSNPNHMIAYALKILYYSEYWTQQK